MKTRRFLSLALSLALACSLSLPAAAAEETADQALSRVTAQVKQTLSIGGEYDEFYGSSYQNVLSTVWSLNWSAKDGSSLYVEAEDDGTVLFCHRGDPDYAGGGYDPAFPSLDRAQAEALPVKPGHGPAEEGKAHAQRLSAAHRAVADDGLPVPVGGAPAPPGQHRPLLLRKRLKLHPPPSPLPGRRGGFPPPPPAP